MAARPEMASSVGSADTRKIRGATSSGAPQSASAALHLRRGRPAATVATARVAASRNSPFQARSAAVDGRNGSLRKRRRFGHEGSSPHPTEHSPQRGAVVDRNEDADTGTIRHAKPFGSGSEAARIRSRAAPTARARTRSRSLSRGAFSVRTIASARSGSARRGPVPSRIDGSSEASEAIEEGRLQQPRLALQQGSLLPTRKGV